MHLYEGIRKKHQKKCFLVCKIIMLQIYNITKSDRNILQILLQEYLSEMSLYYNDIRADENWIYPYKYFENYFTDKDREWFILKIDGEVAGFCLINEFIILAEKWAKAIAEFYIKKEYRKQWLWKQSAYKIFEKYIWMREVRQWINNIPAQRFWEKIINEYTDWKYDKKIIDDEVVMRFEK